MVFKLSNKVHFLQFCADLKSEILSLLKQFEYMHSKSLVTHFQEMVIVYYVMVYCFGDIRVWSIRIFDILVCSDPNKHHFLKECNENFQIQYVNSFNSLRFLPKVSTKLQKMHLYNLRTITQERNMKTRQMSPFLYLLFPLCL